VPDARRSPNATRSTPVRSFRSPSSSRARAVRRPAWTGAGDNSCVSGHPSVSWTVARVGLSEFPPVPPLYIRIVANVRTAAQRANPRFMER
jgi:hypothetical protein